MRADELRTHDVIYLTTREDWVVTSDAQTEGAVAEFSARTKEGGAWSADLTFRFPAAFHVAVVHAWRTVESRCLLCKGTYPHRMDVAAASNPRGVCWSCDMRTTARVLADDGS